MQNPKLILLDRDGVLNEDVGSPGVLCPSKLILTPNAGKSIGKIRRNLPECKIVIVTNQSCVGKKLIGIEKLHKIHKKLKEMLIEEDSDAKIDHVFYCTSTRDMNDRRMKPKPGMVEEACEIFQINPSESLMIGDKLGDLKAAASAGVACRILVETGYGRGIMGRPGPSNYASVDQVKCCSEYDSEENNDPIEMPFYYARNLDNAVSWLIESISK